MIGFVCWVHVLNEFLHCAEMNLSHVISEFSFGPYFPDITQPLDNTYELFHEREYLACVLLPVSF